MSTMTVFLKPNWIMLGIKNLRIGLFSFSEGRINRKKISKRGTMMIKIIKRICISVLPTFFCVLIFDALLICCYLLSYNDSFITNYNTLYRIGYQLFDNYVWATALLFGPGNIFSYIAICVCGWDNNYACVDPLVDKNICICMSAPLFAFLLIAFICQVNPNGLMFNMYLLDNHQFVLSIFVITLVAIIGFLNNLLFWHYDAYSTKNDSM